jgi:Protein of unknown function (DUF2934)
MPTQSKTGKRTTPVVLSRELTDAQQAIVDEPIPSPRHESTHPESGPSPDHETITKRAYELYQQEGCIDGRALNHWLEAERQVLSSHYARD